MAEIDLNVDFQKPYSPLPRKTTQAIREAWNDYKKSVGLEGKDLYDLIKQGVPEDDANQRLEDLRFLRAQLRNDWKRKILQNY